MVSNKSSLAQSHTPIAQISDKNIGQYIFSPWSLLFGCVGIACLRWLWIAGNGDYGVNYETAFRVWHGEVPYRDFIITHPPITHYTLAILLAMFGDSLFLYNVHIYFWWLAALAVGLVLLRTFQVSRATQCAAVLLAASMSLPDSTNSMAYSYMAPVAAGIAMIFFYKFHNRPKLIHLFLGGLFAGLAPWCKQNVGIIAVFIGGVSLLYSCWINKFEKVAAVRAIIIYGLGVLIGFAPLFLIFAKYAGSYEVFHQFLADGAMAKAGKFGLLARAIPRINMAYTVNNRRLYEVILSLPIYLIFSIISWRLISGSNEKNSALPAMDKESSRSLYRWIGSFFIALIILAPVSILALPSMKRVYSSIDLAIFRNNYLFFNNLILIFIFAFCAIWCLKKQLALFTSPLVLPIFYLTAFLAGNIISDQDYIYYAAPIAIPIFLLVLEQAGINRKFCHAAIIAAMLLNFIIYLNCFDQLLPLPANSPFAGMRATADYQKKVVEMWTDVTPIIKGHTTLWLIGFWPHSAYRGLPVKTVPELYKDSFGIRSEKTLIMEWQRNLPEYVVFGAFWGQEDLDLFKHANLEKWVEQRYNKIWQGKENPVSLWQRKSN